MATALTHGASAPRASTPTRDNAREQAGVEGLAQQVSLDSTPKAFATARAQAALLGWQLERAGANYALIRWGRELLCADLQAVQAALARIEGRQ